MSEPTIARCACGTTLGRFAQIGLPGIADTKCIDCTTRDRIVMMLAALPQPEDDTWDNLSEWEQTFLPSVREQFARKRKLSEAQYTALERAWQRYEA